MTENRVRSYQKAWTPELTLYALGDMRLWRPIPARGIVYAVVLELIALLCWHLIGVREIAHALGPMFAFGIIPLGLAALFAVAKIEGRRFHVAFRARYQAWRTPRYLAGGWWPVDSPGKREKFRQPKMRDDR